MKSGDKMFDVDYSIETHQLGHGFDNVIVLSIKMYYLQKVILQEMRSHAVRYHVLSEFPYFKCEQVGIKM